MDITSLIENGVSPKLNFGSLVGLSSFWWWDEHLDAWSGCLDGFVKIIGTAVSFGMASPTIFFPGTHVPPVNILQKTFVEGRYGHTSRFGRITKISKIAFLCLVFLLMQWWKQIWNLNMLDAQNKRLKGKYEINTGLPLGEGSQFRVCEWDSSVF
jgi:hypothetical protein